MLREQLLTRSLLADNPAEHPDDVRCVVMDWGIAGGVATLAAFEDGATSLYLSTGGGIIGGGAHESVRRVAALFREEGSRLKDEFSAVTAFPFPPSGKVQFYQVTDAATLGSALCSANDLASGTHQFSALGNTAQAVISELRDASERAAEPPQ